MSYYSNYGGRYQEGYYASEQLEYPGFDSKWVLGVQTAAAPVPYMHNRAYSSGRYHGSNYGNYHGSSYSSKYFPSRDYGSSYSSNIVAYPHRHLTQPSILTQLFPSKTHTSSSGYPDEVKLKVEICCHECKTKMLDALRNMKGVYDVRVEGSFHAMVSVTGNDLKPKKILKKVQKIIKRTDYWSDWHYSDGVAPHRSGHFAPPSYAPSPRLRHMAY